MYEDYAQSAGTGIDVVDSSKATFRGDFPNCNYTCDKQKSLNVHRIKTRRKEPTVRCHFRGCDYTCSTEKLLKMHNSTNHSQNDTTTTACVKVQHSEHRALTYDSLIGLWEQLTVMMTPFQWNVMFQ